MEDRGCIHKTSDQVRSFLPGKDQKSRSGTFCLQKYGKKDPEGKPVGDCGCVDSSELFYINYNNEPKCIKIDGDYSSFSFERTYDLDVSVVLPLLGDFELRLCSRNVLPDVTMIIFITLWAGTIKRDVLVM